MQLYLIRHAESENNARPEHQRVEDPSITELGRRQAKCLAAWIKTLSIDHLITSPFRRTLETTSEIVAARSYRVAVWHDVFEQGGCYRGHGPEASEGGPGLGRSAIEVHLGGNVACTLDETIGEQGWWVDQARETDEQAAARAARVAQRLESTFGARGETVVAVIHADFKRLLLGEMLRPHIDATRFGPLLNAGVSKLSYSADGWSLDWLNSVSHLPADLIGSGEGSESEDCGNDQV